MVAASGRLTKVASRSFDVGALLLEISRGNNQTDTVGQQVEIFPTVLVLNESRKPVDGQEVLFTVEGGGGSLASSVVDTVRIDTDANGFAEVNWTLGTQAGDSTDTLKAYVDGVDPVFFAASATAGAPTELRIDISPSSNISCGVPFSTQPTIDLVDTYGNMTADSGVVVTATIESGNGILNGTGTTQTDVGGRAV